MKLKAASLALLAVAVTPLFAQPPEELKNRFEEAARRIVRLPPSSFPQLPAKVIRELQRRNCAIPQEVFTKEPHNVIKGAFAKPGQTDWAVLCSVNGVSTILVFWNGSAQHPAEIAPMEDRIFLQGITADQIGFSRRISAVGQEFIMGHYRAYGGPIPPPIGHQGIDDAFVEKASVTLYFHDGNWLKLAGAD